MLLSFATVFHFTALAKGEYFAITADNLNLFVNVDQEIYLEDVSVEINGAALPGSGLTFSSDDAAVQIKDGVLKVSAKGMFTLNVEDSLSNKITVNLLSKNADEKEYVLLEEDFDGIENGSLPEGWTVATNQDVTDDQEVKTAAKQPLYVDQPKVLDGRLVMGNGLLSKPTYVFLPEFLDAFGNLQVEMTAKESFVFNNVQTAGLLLRASRKLTEDGIPEAGYRAVAGRTHTLLGFYDLGNSTQSKTGKGVFPLGSTRAWSRSDQSASNPWKTPAASTAPEWRAEAYEVSYVFSIKGTSYTLNNWRSYEQPQFGGDMGPNNGGWWETYLLKDDPLLEGNELEVDFSEWSDIRLSGAVALATGGAQMSVDSIRVTVPANLLDANPDNYTHGALDPNLASYTTQKIGVMSDIHLCEYATDSDNTLKYGLERMKAEGVTAIILGGDTVNTNLPTEYDKFFSIWNSVFPDKETAPTLLAVTGNHEFEQAYYGRETVQDVYDLYMSEFGYDTLNFHKEINGIHIIGINSETSAVNGGYTATTADWLAAELEAAAADDPYAPIIVVCHETLKNTTYGSMWGSSNTGALYDVLAPYPQVIYLAGHSHFPTENDRCIYQKDFTCVDIPSMQRTCLEDGLGGNVSPNDAFDSQAFLMLEFKGEDKELDIHRYKVNKSSGAITEVKTPWTLALPIDRKNYVYTDERAETRTAPAFASGAKVEVSAATSNSVTIKFPAATHEDYVHAYNIEVTDAAGASLLSKYLVSDFYVTGSHKTEYELDLEGLPSNSKMTVKVTAMESFGKLSEPITGEAVTEPISTKSAARPVADFFDVNLAVGFEDNSPYRRQYSVYVKSHPIKLVMDDELGRQVAYMGGWVNYPASQGSLKEITDHFTIELAFKSPAEAVTAGQCIFGNPESGGITVEYTGSGEFQVGAHIGGGYKYIKVPSLELNTWYHLIYTFDGQKSVLYLNGEKAGEVDSVGSVYFNPNVNFLTIGANVNAVGNAAYVFKGHVALARVFTEAADADKVKQICAQYENEGYLNDIYEKYMLLDRLDTSVMKEADAKRVEEMMAETEKLFTAVPSDIDAVGSYVGRIKDLLTEMMSYDKWAPYGLFTDPLDNFVKIADKSATGIQWENNTEIKKTLLSKNANTDIYVTYKLPGYVREIQLDALSVAQQAAFGDDFIFYVSEDGQNWTELTYDFTEPVANELSDYWVESTLTAKTAGEFTWVKVVLKEFGQFLDPETNEMANRVNWSTVLDGVRIRYADPGMHIPEGQDFIPGDLNNDGELDAVDYIKLKKSILGSIELTDEEKSRADVNGDGEIDALDYIMLKKKVLQG